MTLTATEQDELQRTGTLGNVRPTYGYYRQPNGWVKPAVVTELEELKYRREGWVPLPQYGRFDMGTGYAADHPLELLLMNGGAKELCEEQIRQQGLYMNPPLLPACRQPLTQVHKHHSPSCWVGAKPAHFPQVESMADLGPFDCRFCNRKAATIQGRDQHEAVMHRDEKGDIRTGEALAGSLTKGLSAQAEPSMVEAVKALTQELAKLKRSSRSRSKGRASRSSEI